MRKVMLGRTELEVSAAGLGTGGHSALGLKTLGEDHAASVVRLAYEEGVNFFDTATKYGTEGAVGKGLQGAGRDSYVLSTKFIFVNRDGSLREPRELTETLEDSLRALRTDYIDVYMLQGVFPDTYHEICERYMPALLRAKAEGKIRFLGVSEDFPGDMNHRMLKKALKDDYFDVFMLGYNLLNQSAAREILPQATERGVGVLCMYAVRSALSRPEKLRENISRILESGQADPALLSGDEDLSYLLEKGGAASVTEAAYRFCSHTPGISVTLTGTGNPEHLRENIRSIDSPALPEEVTSRLRGQFGAVDCVTGN